MDIWYIYINVKDFFILMNYNILVIFKVENNLLKFLFYFNLLFYKVVFGFLGV